VADTLSDPGNLSVTEALVVTGWGECLPEAGEETSRGEIPGAEAAFPGTSFAETEALPFLKSRKTLKFMGKQDKLAVAAAGKALRQAAIPAEASRSGLGLYLAVGYIPFERADIEVLAGNSLRAGAFSMDRFSHAALDQINPLLTFRCLPNMPLFHVSLNFGIQGPSFVTYPGAGQFYLALERAAKALRSGKVGHALVGGVADQENFLVDFHLGRSPATRAWKARDAAAFLCLEKRSTAEARGAAIYMESLSLEIGYRAHDPFAAPPGAEETLAWENGSYRADPESRHWGPASPVLLLRKGQGQAGGKELTHSLKTLDGFEAQSRWRVL
jgi:3-oxoacyl-(acyl-carrier-protein) synthase